MQEGPHLDLLNEALATEAEAQRALLAGQDGAADGFERAAQLYRASWELASPTSFGRLIGMLKAAVIAGDGATQATYALGQLPADATSPPASYARAIAALIQGDDAGAAAAAEGMRAGSPAFGRAADAIAALAAGDEAAYSVAVAVIVEDFESRDGHVTGVAIADTALMLERLAQARGVASRPRSALLPDGA